MLFTTNTGKKKKKRFGSWLYIPPQWIRTWPTPLIPKNLKFRFLVCFSIDTHGIEKRCLSSTGNHVFIPYHSFVKAPRINISQEFHNYLANRRIVLHCFFSLKKIQSQPLHFLAVTLDILCPSFLICKMGIITVHISQDSPGGSNGIPIKFFLNYD